jgi:hypothetical protein
MDTSSLSILYIIISLASFLLFAKGLHLSRNTHNRAFQIESCRIDTRKMSFFPRTVRDWNLLPPDIVELDTPEDARKRE